MNSSIDKLKEILIILKESHKYELDQNDQFTYRSQLIFLAVAIYFNVAFIAINSSNTIILILRITLLIFLGLSIFWALPIRRKSGYKVSPKIDSLISNFVTDKYNHEKLLLYLINTYKISIHYNKAKNLKRHKDFRLGIIFLGLSTLLLIIILAYSLFIDC